MDWWKIDIATDKVTDRVTRTCDQGKQAFSQENSWRKEALNLACRVAERFLEVQLSGSVPVQKAKLELMSRKIREEVNNLIWEDLQVRFGGSSGDQCEKTLREKCLEAAYFSWKTAKEVCRDVNPGLVEGSSDWNRALKSVSMCLLRLSRNRSEKLMDCDRSGRKNKYRTVPKGRKRLWFYKTVRVRARRSKALHGRMEKIVKMNEEFIPEIEAMQTCQSAALQLVENADQSKAFQHRYGRITGLLASRLALALRTMIEDDDDLRVATLRQGVDALLQLSGLEAEMTDFWQWVREEQKELERQLREKNREIEELKRARKQ